ncbi:hypothetical protein ES703_02968 [subsurface metagenome]
MLTKEEQDLMDQIDESIKTLNSEAKTVREGNEDRLKKLEIASDKGQIERKRLAEVGAGVMENKTEDLSPLIFLDAEGKEHKALRASEKLSEGIDQDFSVGKILRARILGSLKGLNDLETKAASEGIGSAGGWMIPEFVSARIIDLARNLACVQKAGAVTMQMESPEMRLVKILSDPTASWLAEHGEIQESNWEIGPVNLKAQTIGVLCRASLEILEDAQNAGSMLEQAMAAAISLAMDRVSILGDGVKEPKGLDLCSDVNLISMGVNGGALTNYDPFSVAIEAVADHNGEAGAVIFSPRTFFTLDRLKAATTNQPLIPPQSFVDLKKFKTNQILNTDKQGTCTTASKAFIGDWKNVLYGIRKQLEVEITKQGGTKTFAKCEALIRCRMRLDVAILRENHFSKIEGIKV